MKPVIQFESKEDDPDVPAREVVATIWPVIDDEGESALDEAVIKSFPILIGGGGLSSVHSSLELPSAGTYLVDVAFPSGQRTRRTISVEDSQDYKFVLSDKLGAVRAPAVGNVAKTIPRVIAAARSLIGLSSELEVKRLKSPHAPRCGGLRDLSVYLERLGAGATQVETIERVAAADLRYSKSLPAREALSFGRSYERSWLLIAGSGKEETLICYPEEWGCKNGDGAFRLNVTRTLTKGSGEGTKWRTHLELRDSYYGSIVEYLNRRDTKATNAVVGSIRARASEMLDGKGDNPFAAAAGSYLFALGATLGSEHHSWMVNLCDRFPWLADGPIALGWWLLRNGTSESKSWKEARGRFLEGVDRGLPYYSVGLHILVDGLTLLSMAFPEDREIRDSLAAATAADLACVRSEPFTTLQIWRYRRIGRS